MVRINAAPTLIINNEVIPYEPTSISWKKGNPTRQVKSQVVGEGKTENAVAEDFETAKGMVKFDLLNTTENSNRYTSFQDNFDANVIKIVFNDGKTFLFENAVVIEDAEQTGGVDGMIPVEFESDRGVETS